MAVKAQAIVELTSPTTSSASGFCLAMIGSNPLHHLGGLNGMGTGADAKIDIGTRNLELLEEQLRHFLIVMLPGMDQISINVASALNLPHDRRDLHEIGASPADSQDFHFIFPVSQWRDEMTADRKPVLTIRFDVERT